MFYQVEVADTAHKKAPNAALMQSRNELSEEVWLSYRKIRNEIPYSGKVWQRESLANSLL